MFCKCCQDSTFLKKLNQLAQNNEHKLSLNTNINQSQSQLLGPLGLGVVAPSNNIYIDSLSWVGSKWNWSQGSTNKLKYCFAPAYSVEDCPQGVKNLNYDNVNQQEVPISTTVWNEDEKTAMRLGLQKWTEIVGMDIEEVIATSQGDENNADLKFYVTTDSNFEALGAQFGPHSSPYHGIGVYLRNTGDLWSTSLQPGGFGFFVILHELGHGLGLAHPHDIGGGSYGASSNGRFPGVIIIEEQKDEFIEKGNNDLNQCVFTVMSYVTTRTDLTPSSYEPYGFLKGPMGFDIATMEHLYGLSDNFNNGNDVYIITEGEVGGVDGYTCIYDSGGTDLIQYNGNKIVTIDLRAGTLQNEPGGGGFISKVDQSNIYSGFSIANGVTIEDATGGSNNDTIYQVDSVSNVIDGRTGIDTVIYQNNFEDYSLDNISGDGTHLIVSNGSAEDILYNIEKLQFKNITIDTSMVYSNSTYLSDILTPITISELNNIITHDIVITDNPNQLESLEVLLKNIKHTWVGDLIITLKNIDTNTEVILSNLSGSGKYGSSANNFVNVILSDNALSDIDSISTENNISGKYYPSNNGGDNRTFLNVFNNQNINSRWRLQITDTYPSADNGQLIEWGLKFYYNKSGGNDETTSVYSSSPELEINNSNRVITDDIVINDNGQSVLDLVVVINDLEHAYVGDIKMTLTKIDSGVSLVLMNKAGTDTPYGSSGNNFVDLVLTDEALESIDSIPSEGTDYTGEYKPSDNSPNPTELSSFDGLDINGTWRLQIEDTYPSVDHGTLKQWSLRIRHNQVNQAPVFKDVEADDGTYTTGDIISIIVSWDKIVIVSGTPYPELKLSNNAVANYISGSNSKSLIFNYQVSSGKDISDLKVSNYIGTITDSAGNQAQNIIDGDLGSVIIDTTGPTFGSVSALNGTYTTNDTVKITVSWNENVVVSGIPQLQLSNDAEANYDTVFNSKSLIFNYTVSSTDNDTADLQVSGYTGTITDTAGNTAENFSNKDLGSVIIDTTAPKFVSVSAPTGTYTVNQTIQIMVSWDKNVSINLSSQPHLILVDGSHGYYQSGSGSPNLVFEYTISTAPNNELKIDSYSGNITGSGGLAAQQIPNDTDKSVVGIWKLHVS